MYVDCPVPFAVIFGGTDLNENTKVKADREIVIKIALSAKYVSSFIDDGFVSINDLKVIVNPCL